MPTQMQLAARGVQVRRSILGGARWGISTHPGQVVTGEADATQSGVHHVGVSCRLWRPTAGCGYPSHELLVCSADPWLLSNPGPCRYPQRSRSHSRSSGSLTGSAHIRCSFQRCSCHRLEQGPHQQGSKQLSRYLSQPSACTPLA